MRITRVVAVVVALVAGVLGLAPQQAHAAALPNFPMLLPIGWGYTVQAGGAHTHASGVRSSVDLGAAGNVSVPVVAVADGTVTVKGAGGFSRCYVVIEHTDGWQTQYYHLKGIPAGLTNGQKVKAGDRIGMTGMPGSETCGRGTFRHVHLSLYRYGVEQPISGISLGGYAFTTTSGSYCGYWTRERDNVIVADARRACLAVPAVANTIVHPDNLGSTATGPEGPPAISETDTISPALLYTTEGQHSVSGRAWRTTCEKYSAGRRCFTDIWATQVRSTATGFEMTAGWFFNNLTYADLTARDMASNPLGTPGTWTADDRQWKTECNTPTTGNNGCRSWIKATTYSAVKDASGAYRFTALHGWTFNNMVRFAAPTRTATSASASTSTRATTLDVAKAPVADADVTPAPVPASPAASAENTPSYSAEPSPAESAAPEASPTVEPSASTPGPSPEG